MSEPKHNEMDKRVALWTAIDCYAVACGGDPAQHVYGNTARQVAVADVENIVFQQNATTPKTGTLAERLYAARMDEDALFNGVNEIMGCDVSKCLDAEFKFAVLDTFWDDYDCSVEVVLDQSTPWPTDEQATKILGLGFSQIYVSRGEEMETISAPDEKLTRYHCKEGRSRAGTDDNRWRSKYLALQAKIGRPTITTHE